MVPEMSVRTGFRSIPRLASQGAPESAATASPRRLVSAALSRMMTRGPPPPGVVRATWRRESPTRLVSCEVFSIHTSVSTRSRVESGPRPGGAFSTGKGPGVERSTTEPGRCQSFKQEVRYPLAKVRGRGRQGMEHPLILNAFSAT